MQNIEGKRERIYRKGEMLFKESDAAEELYIIQSGEVRIFRTAHGNEFELGVLTRGSVIGELALFDKSPRSASGQALTDCRVVFIDKGHFGQQLEKIPTWMAAIIRIIIKRLRTMTNQVQEASSHDLSGKVARMLEYVYTRYQTRSGGEEYITMEKANIEISLLGGIPLEKLGALYEILMTRNLIRMERGKIFVPQPALLITYAHYKEHRGDITCVSSVVLTLLHALIVYGEKKVGKYAQKVVFNMSEFKADFETITGQSVQDDALDVLHKRSLVHIGSNGTMVSKGADKELSIAYDLPTARTLLEEQKLYVVFEHGDVS